MQNFEEATSRVAKRGLHLVKARARRHDPVGQATYRALEVVSGGLSTAARALRELGQATQPPARTPSTRPAPAAPAEKATRPTTARRRTTRKTA
jgi:hypothetical protein